MRHRYGRTKAVGWNVRTWTTASPTAPNLRLLGPGGLPTGRSETTKRQSFRLNRSRCPLSPSCERDSMRPMTKSTSWPRLVGSGTRVAFCCLASACRNELADQESLRGSASARRRSRGTDRFESCPVRVHSIGLKPTLAEQSESGRRVHVRSVVSGTSLRDSSTSSPRRGRRDHRVELRFVCGRP